MQGYYRAARAALRVEKWDECQRLCEAGLMVDQGATELQDIAKVPHHAAAALPFTLAPQPFIPPLSSFAFRKRE